MGHQLAQARGHGRGCVAKGGGVESKNKQWLAAGRRQAWGPEEGPRRSPRHPRVGAPCSGSWRSAVEPRGAVRQAAAQGAPSPGLGVSEHPSASRPPPGPGAGRKLSRQLCLGADSPVCWCLRGGRGSCPLQLGSDRQRPMYSPPGRKEPAARHKGQVHVHGGAALQRPFELVPREVLPDGGLGAGGISQFPPDHLWGGRGCCCEGKAHPKPPLGACGHKLPSRSRSPVSPRALGPGEGTEETLRPNLCTPTLTTTLPSLAQITSVRTWPHSGPVGSTDPGWAGGLPAEEGDSGHATPSGAWAQPP